MYVETRSRPPAETIYRTCFRDALGLNDMWRSDARVDDDGTVVFEIAPRNSFVYDWEHEKKGGGGARKSTSGFRPDAPACGQSPQNRPQCRSDPVGRPQRRVIAPILLVSVVIFYIKEK